MFKDGMDLAYRPFDGDAWEWLAKFAPETLLVLGKSTEEHAAHAEALKVGDARTLESNAAKRHLHDGLYVSRVEGSVRAVAAVGSANSAIETQARYRTDDSHLGMAHDFLIDFWSSASPLLGSAELSPGDLVRPRSSDALGRVRRLIRRHDHYEVEVELGTSVQSFQEVDLQKVDGDPSAPDFWINQPPANAESITLLLSLLKLTNPLTDLLYSFAATKTTFQPYQFIPALKILTSATGRLLIADEVGLGKTIEAGLIWTELEQRTTIRRALVVVPAALQFKWKQEMERRFMRPLKILTKQDLREFVLQLREDQDPELIGVISIDALRGASDLLADLAELHPHFDLVIVDEAHVLRNRQTRSYQLGALLSDLADYLVFLSATPLNLGSNDLFNLVNLLDEGGFPDAAVFEGQLEPNRALNEIARNLADSSRRSRAEALALLATIPAMTHGAAIARRPDFQRLEDNLAGSGPISQEKVAAMKRQLSELNTLGGVLSRTRKVDVPTKKAKRVAESIPVEWTQREREFYDALFDFYRNRAIESGVPTGFALQMPLRQASSCLVVAQGRLLSREGWVEPLEDAEMDFVSDAEPMLNSPSLPSTSTMSGSLGADSKFAALLSRLQKARANGMPQALIFSFFRGTADYVAARLKTDFRTGVLHGGVPVADRQAILDRFSSGEIEILVATQVGSEGLDFQFCNVLVNYDLPWNPMQVEQRIGRLDRFGQKFDKIFIFNMHVPGTIESDIIERLYQRIGVFEDSVGDLEPIMHSTLHDITHSVLNPNLSRAEMIVEIDRLAIATERRKEQLKELEKSSAVLTTVSQLDIDGLTPSGPTSGRYVGASELDRLVRLTFARYGGTVSSETARGSLIVRGTPEMAVAMRDIPRSSRGTMIGIGRLIGQLRDGAAIEVTTSSDVALAEDLELITARHPLIALATQSLIREPHLLGRFGAVELSNSLGSKYVARVDIARSNGVREICEIWVTAINVETGERDTEVESRLMVDVAEGTLQTTSAPSYEALQDWLKKVDNEVSARQSFERSERSQDNVALVDARIDSERHSVTIKLDRARLQLTEHLARHAESSLRRMLEGRIRNLTQEYEDTPLSLEKKRSLTLSVERAATLFVVG